MSFTAKAGVAYVDVKGDLSSLNRTLAGFFGGSKFAGMGRKAGVGIGVGLAAGLAGKALFDLGEKFDEQFDKIRVGSGKTGKVLDGLEDDFRSVVKSVPTDFGSAGDAISELSRRTKLTGEPLRRLTKTILQLSRITGTDAGDNVRAISRLFGDWSVTTGDQESKLNKLFRVTQKTGIELGDLSRLMVKFGSPLRTLGFDFEQTAAMFGRFEREGVNLQTTLPGFKQALKNFAKPTEELSAKFKKFGVEAEEPRKALLRIFELIKSLPEREGTQLAFQVFGSRAATDMARAVKEGRFELDDLLKSMSDGSDTINKAEKDTRDFGEEWQILKNRIFVGLEPLASKVFDTIGDGMEKFAKLSPALQAITVGVPGVLLALGPLAAMFSMMGRNVTTLGSAFGLAGGGAAKAAPQIATAGRATAATTGAMSGMLASLRAAPGLWAALGAAVVIAGVKIKNSKTFEGLAGGIVGKETGKIQAQGIAAMRSGLDQLAAASQRATVALPAVAAAEKNLSTLSKQGKTDTHAYAEAIRTLDAAQGERISALRQRTDAEKQVLFGINEQLRAASGKLLLDRKHHASAAVLKADAIALAQAYSRQQAGLLNVSRAMRGLTPITGATGTKMGALLKTLQGVAGLPQFKKFLVTADISSANAAVRVVERLQKLGRVKTALKIIAESKSPEAALKSLREKLGELTRKRHDIRVKLKDEATIALHKLGIKLGEYGRKNPIEFLAKIKQATPFADDVFPPPNKKKPRARGGVVGLNELSLVGEEGPELAKYAGKTGLVGLAGPEIRSFPENTRIYSHPETKRKLAPVIQKVSRVLDGKSLPGVEGVKQSQGQTLSRGLGGRRLSRVAEGMGIPGFKAGGTVKASRSEQVPGLKGETTWADVGEKIRKRMRDVWEVAQPYFRAGGEPMPSIRFPKHEKSKLSPYAWVTPGTNKVTFSPEARGQFAQGDDWAEKTLLHEWAHVMQGTPGKRMKVWETEGGAEAFAQRVSGPVYRKLKIPFRRTPDAYAAWTRRVRKEKGFPWILGEQFGYTPGKGGGRQEEPAAKKPDPKAKAAQVLRDVPATLKQAWGATAPRLHAAGFPMPAVAFRKPDIPALATTGPGPSGLDQVIAHPAVSSGLSKGDAQMLRVIIHEWGHIFQLGTRNDAQLEGGADAFARRALRPVADALGFTGVREALKKHQEFRRPIKRLKKRRGKGFEDYVMNRQFGYRSSGKRTKAGQKTAQELGDWIWYETGGPKDHKNLGRAASSLQPAARYLASTMKEKFGLSVSPQGGVRPGDSGSFHSVGKAVDLVGTKMREGAEWVKSSGLYKTLLEGIHNPNLSTDSGKLVSPGFWGSGTWAGHRDHVHLAASRIIKTAKDKVAEKKGPKRISGGSLSLGQMVTLSKKVGFPDPALAAAVGYAESRGKVGAVGDGGDSLGPWQINTPAHPKYDKDRLANDAFYNARAALAISKKGKNWQPWTQFRTGAYKQFLGGKGKPLPKGTSKGTPSGSKYTDFLAMKLYDAETDTPADPSDDIRWINRALRYYRGVRKRNKAAGNWARADEAKHSIVELLGKKKTLRGGDEEPTYENLGSLAPTIGNGTSAVNTTFWEGQLEQINLEKARASLTLPADTDDSLGGLKASLQDDIAAQSKLVTIWDGLNKLVSGYFWPTGPVLSEFKPTPEQSKQLSKTKSQPQRIALLNKFQADWKARGQREGNWVEGTIGQKIEAATSLGSAKDDLRNLLAEINKAPETIDTPANDAKEQIRAFMAAIGDLTKTFGSNFRPLQSFADGGIIQGPKGRKVVIEGHGGEAVINEDGNLVVTIDPKQLERMIQQPTVVNNVDARHTFANVPKDPHRWSQAVKGELTA